jgi:N-acetylmuramoyl-L-alanine amidase
MNHSRATILVLLAGVALILAGPVVAPRAADQLLIITGEKRQTVDSRERDGRPYFELRDLIAILGLSYQEQGDRLTLMGPRGDLELTDKRRLARLRDEYILLDQPPWRRKEREWYVSEDFLEKALPLILQQKLEKQASLRYRVRPLDENTVRVEVSNFPDHVRIVFTPSRASGIRIQEGKDSIQVKFDSFLVVPELPQTEADSRMVKGIRFVAGDTFGAFEITKGSDYYNFREYSLEQPGRRVIDVYAPPATAAGPPVSEPSPAGPEPSPSGLAPPPAAPAAPEAVPVFRARQFGNVVTIDPGHGGEDYGAKVGQDVFEKNYTLRIAQRIEQRLRSTRYRGILTRGQDLDLGLEQRSAIGNYYQSKCYVSVHVGGAPTQEAKGPVVYVQRYSDDQDSGTGGPRLIAWEAGQRPFVEQSRGLADLIQAELNAVYGVKNNVIEVPMTQLEPLQAPAVVVEVGFLTNPDDRAELDSPDFQDRIAGAVAKAIERFLP